MLRSWCVSMLAMTVVGGSACGGSADAAKCSQMADHIIEVQKKELAAQAGGAESTDAMLAMVDAGQKLDAHRGSLIEKCTDKVPASLVECVLKGDSSAAIQACKP